MRPGFLTLMGFYANTCSYHERCWSMGPCILNRQETSPRPFQGPSTDEPMLSPMEPNCLTAEKYFSPNQANMYQRTTMKERSGKLDL
uniref:Secreted protein n=1 Tax=Steinernema glaseri TaxID=37863 RepID=A0A1I7YUI2_9BILA